MTFQVRKSHIGDDTAVAQFHERVVALRHARLAHMKTTGVPAPSEHPLIEACIQRVIRGDEPDDHVADYEVIDDIPKKSLRDKKDDLIRQIGMQEQKLLIDSMPPGKRAADHHRYLDLFKKTVDEMTPDDVSYLVARKERVQREEIIQRYAARLAADVEDLTEDTIGKWQPEPFPQ